MPTSYEEQRRQRDAEREAQERSRRERDELREYQRRQAGYSESGSYDPDVSDFDRDSADIPIWGWLSGAQARRDAATGDAENRRMQSIWERLSNDQPSAMDLTPEYSLEGTMDAYGDLLGGESELGGFAPTRAQSALDQFGQIMEGGGYTDADRATQQATRASQAQWLGSQNAAAMQQAQARGMGGGGQELAARLSAGQAANMGNVAGDAAMQQSAMQRLMGATAGYGQLGMGMDAQEMSRRNALDDFNQRRLDWRRGREERNTGWANRQSDAGVSARQTAYQNRERQAAGTTGQYQAGAQERMFGQQRQDQANQAGGNVIGSIISEIL